MCTEPREAEIVEVSISFQMLSLVQDNSISPTGLQNVFFVLHSWINTYFYLSRKLSHYYYCSTVIACRLRTKVQISLRMKHITCSINLNIRWLVKKKGNFYGGRVTLKLRNFRFKTVHFTEYLNNNNNCFCILNYEYYMSFAF